MSAAVSQIRRRSDLLVTLGTHRPAMPMAGPNKPSLPHQLRNSPAAVLLAMPLEFGMDARRPISLARTGHSPRRCLKWFDAGGSSNHSFSAQPRRYYILSAIVPVLMHGIMVGSFH